MYPLRIELSEIFDEGITRHFAVSGAALGIDDPAWELAQPIELDYQLFKVKHEVVVHGTLRTALQLTCSRCVEAFELPLQVPLDAIYLPGNRISSERAEELEEGGADVYAYAEHVIDLAEMVRDKVFLSVPLQPRCTTACKGLCPRCGTNRNITTCHCVQEDLGSPFQRLKELRFS